ncbi:hypothetical protein A6V39_05140 [Candidatus Mycoplasma haematobovis]|uniref:Uncharacterized protein n=1 Tax=Candidatus Mycoplasma haematobovis TaxID=432608 RepID=A0A1A9QBI2_9MOLU|nr:hypothetical protein [Candidatus Mycoplasma haematobovis]OAL09813.1 hypothetical protein A6V39_05140 [Candidatus Mycoplasma haematobovis]
MSKFLPIVAGATGTAIIAGGGGYLLSTQNTKIRDTFKEALINLDTETDLVNEKLEKLKENSSDPKHPKLKEAKTKESSKKGDGLKDFKSACQEIYDSSFTNKNSDTFKDFQSFCARTIKDRITKTGWATNNAKWKDRFNKLKVDATKPSSDSLKQIATKDSATGDELKNWCETKANEVFEGEKNLEFKDASASCGAKD